MQIMDEIVDKLVSHFVAPLNDYNAGLSVEALKKKYNVSKIAKLGSNENPFETPESVRNVLNEMHNLAHYPDPGCHELKTTLGQRYNTPPSHIVTGNGSEDIINMICHTFLEEGDSVLTVTPSFGLHILYPESHGANVIISRMTGTLTFDIDDLTQKLEEIRPKLFFIASPSNPVGCTLSSSEVDRLLSHQHSETLLVFDEAYFEFAACEDGYFDILKKLKSSGKPFILLRTFSKAYSLAGLRIGYALCATENMATYLNKVRLPFNVNRLAQKAAIAALSDTKHLGKTLTWNKQARAMLFNELTKLELNPIPSQGNFLFFSTPHPSADIAEQLLTKGVIVKAWTEENYTNYLRVSVGTDEENQHFITSLRAILNETG